MTIGSNLAVLDGYPFEVRYSEGSFERARFAADIATEAYDYFAHLFPGVRPNIAVIVANKADWESRQPYGLPFFNDNGGQIQPGIVVMPAGSGEFWIEIVEDLRNASPKGYETLLATYPDGGGGVDLQPFFDLVTIHELGHAFEVLGDLRTPTFWLGEVFANLALHAFIATMRPGELDILQTLSNVGANCPLLDARFRTEGYSTLEEVETHYTGGEAPMSPSNYVWFQYRWQRLAAKMYEDDGDHSLVRLWNCFHARDRFCASEVNSSTLADLLSAEVSEALGEAVRNWR